MIRGRSDSARRFIVKDEEGIVVAVVVQRRSIARAGPQAADTQPCLDAGEPTPVPCARRSAARAHALQLGVDDAVPRFLGVCKERHVGSDGSCAAGCGGAAG